MSWRRNLFHRVGIAAAAVSLLGLLESASAATLRIDSRADWESWTYAKGTLELTSDGLVRPRYFRKNINACRNAGDFVWEVKGKEFSGGIRNAGSNAPAAPRILDGDLSTSWGPRRSDDPENWWVEIDLGRMVTATKLILRFDSEADPFEEFKVFTSNGMPAFVSAAVAGALDYRIAASITKPNREMELEFPLHDLSNQKINHRSVRYVYVLLTAWRDPQTHPRLAELEVISLGDNIALGALERGGDISAYSAGGVAGDLIDGDGVSQWNSTRWGVFPEAHWYFHLNLGGLFWVDTIVIDSYTPGILGSQVTPPVHHSIDVSDGTPQPGSTVAWEAKGPYVWTQIEHVSQNPPPGMDRQMFVLDTKFEPRRVARIFYDHLTPRGVGAGQIRIREVQVFGEGYIAKATLQSRYIDLGAPSAISAVDWVADTPGGSGVEIRTRTGDEIIEEVKYLDANGQPVRDRNNNGTSEDDYNKLPPFRKGEILTEIKAGPGWSSWSRPYLVSGDEFQSPSPRRYVQIQAALTTKTAKEAATLDMIQLTYAPPLVRHVVGEVWPLQVRAAAEPEDFSFFIRPTFDAPDRGFDEVLILTPSQARFRGLRLGGLEVTPDSIYSRNDSLWLHLPQVVRRQADPLIEVQFRCTVFLNNTPFDAFLGYSSNPGIWQRVDAGEANEAVDSQQIIVQTPQNDELLSWAAKPHEVFTPNDDGINDDLPFEFIVYKINMPQPLGVRIYGLDGVLIRELLQSGISGQYRITWDGRDETGRRVDPGLYLGQVFVEGAKHHPVLNQVVAVAY